MRILDEWLLTPELTAVHLPTATAVLADLHLGYSEARQRGGEAVPAFNLDTALQPLGRAIVSHGIRRLVIAGDLFEAAADAVLVGALITWIRRAGVDLAGVVPGNHDRGIEHHPLPLCPEGLSLGRWRVVHGDGALPVGRVVHGHLHPCVRLGNGLSAPCYLTSRERIILPAFSADACGVDVLGMTAWPAYRCCVPVAEQVLDFGAVAAVRRARRINHKGTETQRREKLP
jgi:putative SbcD/Mre11-related phosphoesterase